jgi:hypothetical protein
MYFSGRAIGMETQQTTNVAVRMRRRRQRRRQGLVVFSFEGDEIEVPEILVEAGFHRAFATGTKNRRHPSTKSISENGAQALPIAVHFRQ